jgi:hypothetical protein
MKGDKTVTLATLEEKEIVVRTVAVGAPRELRVAVPQGAHAATVLAAVRRETGEDAFRLTRPGGGFFESGDLVYHELAAGQMVFAVRDSDIGAG